MRVLLVESDEPAAQLAIIRLKADGLNVDAASDGEEGIDLAKIYDYDAILVESVLPDMRGAEVLRAIRLAKVRAPIVIISAYASVDDRVAALNAGADDYIIKPYELRELVARVRAIVRRSKGHSDSVIQTGDLALNLDTKTCQIAGKNVKLTGKEYQMLELLCLRKGMTLSKEIFLNHLYGGLDEPEVKIIDVFICKLRRKLKHATGKIETVWGRGYVLRDPLGEVPSPSLAPEIADLIGTNHRPRKRHGEQPKAEG